ncbi:uncharacterized protein LOC122378179 [Amphibalanus amphitrite]|uniref:uncharacterized protein LOC122378179 n=1 Tax=Amphibalanus amphitrite TaxID=1232801 RepID=UPI001C902DD7|nr:uncharacterized protein LOC122378179 [Amphibalanus amphitrite]
MVLRPAAWSEIGASDVIEPQYRKYLGFQYGGSWSSWEARLLWSPGAREDLSWWVSSLDGWNGRLLVPPAVCELQLSTDASGSGWGAVLSTPSCQLASGFWDQLLDRMFGPHTVDRFAAVGTALLPTYNSRFADPCSSGVDALGQTDWGAENNWVNPPFRLIPRVLDIIEAQRADATLIAPMWPGQPWMARLRRLCTAPPIRLPPVTRIKSCKDCIKSRFRKVEVI